MIELIHKDCMELLKDTTDEFYDLAIVDPPYGIKMHGGKRQYNTYDNKDWDYDIPKEEYFKELFRVSKNQIIWGGNYFTDFLFPSRCWLIWDKTIHGNTFADGEAAWTSFNKNLRIYPLNICHNQGKRFHPTQKPVKLYEWILLNYAKENYKILDTHGGSMSIALAVHNVNQKEQMNLSLTLTELDEDYYKAGVKRYQNHIKQKTIFDL